MRLAEAFSVGLLLFIGSEQALSTPAAGEVSNAQAVTSSLHYETAAGDSDARLVPIRSSAQLTEYLGSHPSNPLDAFNQRARKLFLESLTFSDRGLTGFRLQEVQSELTRTQAFAILSLFGVESVVDSLQFERADNSKPLHPASGSAAVDGILAQFADKARAINREVDNVSQKVAQLQNVLAEMEKQVDIAGIGALSDQDAKDFCEIAETLAFYSNTPSDVHRMRRSYDELEKRGIATRLQGQAMRDQYVAARMIPEAIALAHTNRDLNLKPIPAFVRSGNTVNAPVLWQMSADGATLTDHAFHLEKLTGVVVVASPWCSFSQAASNAISRDSGLSKMMERNSTWLLGQSKVPDFEGIRTWNLKYPGYPLQIVDRNAEWPSLELDQTPVFLFYRGGQRISTVLGWPGEEQLEKLRDGFSSIGLTGEDSTESAK